MVHHMCGGVLGRGIGIKSSLLLSWRCANGRFSVVCDGATEGIVVVVAAAVSTAGGRGRVHCSYNHCVMTGGSISSMTGCCLVWFNTFVVVVVVETRCSNNCSH